MVDNDDKAGIYMHPPSGSFSSWENTMCNPLGDMRTQMQSAWHDGYATAKVEREWVGLTDEDIKSIVFVERSWTDAVRKVEAKLKEKNSV